MKADQQVDAVLFRELLDMSAMGLFASAAGGTLVTICLLVTGSPQIVFYWLGALVFTVGVRAFLVARSTKRLSTLGYRPQEATLYAMSVGLSGFAWGLIAFFIDGIAPIAFVVAISIVQSMVMGGVITLGAFMPAFLAFSIPALLPLSVVMAINGSVGDTILAAYNVSFLLLMINIAGKVNKSLRKSQTLALENENLVKALTDAQRHLTSLAKTDGLTGIANRRSFDEALKQEFSRLQRSGEPLSLIFLDVDHFKLYNDSYGHVSGDHCLKEIAGILQNLFHRGFDLAARYGGEEFAGILPETNHEGALHIAEEIRTEVAKLAIPHFTSPTSDSVTVSLGVATIDCREFESPSEALEIVDRLLYRAKLEGRNRIAAWDGTQRRVRVSAET